MSFAVDSMAPVKAEAIAAAPQPDPISITFFPQAIWGLSNIYLGNLGMSKPTGFGNVYNYLLFV